MRRIIGFFCISLVHLTALPGDSVIVCDVGGRSAKRVEVIRENEIAGSYIYSLRYSGKTERFFGNAENSRGMSVRVTCAGHRTRALVAVGEFTAAYPQGFVLTYGSAGHIERLDFAERSPPEWLYLGTKETIIVIPTHGYGETNKKYVAYRRINGSTADAEAEGIDVLPAADRFEVIKVTWPRHAP